MVIHYDNTKKISIDGILDPANAKMSVTFKVDTKDLCKCPRRENDRFAGCQNSKFVDVEFCNQ